MDDGIAIEPMTEDFVLWRCLHDGPMSRITIDQWSEDTKMPWDRYRVRNRALLSKLTDVYGACAIVARDGDDVIGQLRFYPKAVWKTEGAGLLCLQQDYPAGPTDDLASREFSPLEDLADKTLQVHCLMAGPPDESGAKYKRKGLATRMGETLITWARAQGWEAIEANSFEDIPVLYQWTGCAGHTFWEKLGFHVADRFPHPDFEKYPDLLRKILEQAQAADIAAERAKDRIVMRFELT